MKLTIPTESPCEERRTVNQLPIRTAFRFPDSNKIYVRGIDCIIYVTDLGAFIIAAFGDREFTSAAFRDRDNSIWHRRDYIELGEVTVS